MTTCATESSWQWSAEPFRECSYSISATSVLRISTRKIMWSYVLTWLSFQIPEHIFSPSGYIWWSSHLSHSFIWYFYRFGITTSHLGAVLTSYAEPSSLTLLGSIILYTGRGFCFQKVFCCIESGCVCMSSIHSEWIVFVSCFDHMTGNGLFFDQSSSPDWSYIRCLGRVRTFGVSWHSHILFVKCWITLSEMSVF